MNAIDELAEIHTRRSAALRLFFNDWKLWVLLNQNLVHLQIQAEKLENLSGAEQCLLQNLLL